MEEENDGTMLMLAGAAVKAGANSGAAGGIGAKSAGSGGQTTGKSSTGGATGGKAGAAGGKTPADDESSKLIPLDIYYGSQTGTAENFAKSLVNEAKRHGFKGHAIDMCRYTKEKLAEGGLAIFLMATYGEGDPTDNAVEFVRWISGADESAPLKKLKFTVFGLGNKQYEHYNKMGKVVNARLEALGAQRVYKHGEGDDDGSMEEDFENWKTGGLWQALLVASGAAPSAGAAGATASSGAAATPSGNDRESFDLPTLPWTLAPLPGRPERGSIASQEELDSLADRADRTSKHFFRCHTVVVAENRELRQVHGVGNSTRHIELDIAGCGLAGYNTADNLYVLPENDAKVVASVAASQDYDLDAWFSLERKSDVDVDEAAALPFPTPLSVRTLLSQYIDLHGIPRRELLGFLSHFASMSDDAALLRKLASAAGRADYHAVVLDSKLSVYELFDLFPSLRVPLEVFAQIMPKLQPRAYTISSSARVQPQRIAVTVSVIDEPKAVSAGAATPAPAVLSRLPANRRLRGVCSAYLSELSVGSRARVYVRESTFRMPADPSLPIVCVGPGTGFAPVRAFLHERRAQRIAGEKVGPMVVFFGCRKRDDDFIYQSEIDSFVRDGTITSLHLAFSRETSAKVYVQHKIADDAQNLFKLLGPEGNGYMYVCGGTRMGHDVAAAVAEKVFAAAGGMPAVAAAGAVKTMQDSTPRRYIQELWTASA